RRDPSPDRGTERAMPDAREVSTKSSGRAEGRARSSGRGRAKAAGRAKSSSPAKPTSPPAKGASPSEGLDRRQLLSALRAFKRGDFSTRLPEELSGMDAQICQAFNDVVMLASAMADESAELRR